MPGPLPRELRERVVAAYNNGAGTYKELAEQFKVGSATAERWVARERKTGSLEPDAMGGARHPRKVDAAGEELVRELLSVLPDSTLDELVETYEHHFGVSMHRATMGRALARMGFTRKRGR